MENFIESWNYGGFQKDMATVGANVELIRTFRGGLSIGLSVGYEQISPIFYTSSENKGADDPKAEWSFHSIPITLHLEYTLPLSSTVIFPIIGIGVAYSDESFEQKSNYGLTDNNPPQLEVRTYSTEGRSFGWVGEVGFLWSITDRISFIPRFGYKLDLEETELPAADQYGGIYRIKVNLSAFYLDTGVQVNF